MHIVKRDKQLDMCYKCKGGELATAGIKMIDIIYPCESRSITNPYGSSGSGDGHHDGVDFACPLWSDIYAVASGQVAGVKNSSSYGKYLVIQHSGYCSLYAHLSSITVNVGQLVEQSEIVAKSGNTGNSTGPHLHFEIRLGSYVADDFWKSTNGKFENSVDPIVYLKDSSDWRIEMGKKALWSLHNKGLVSNPDTWEQNLLEPLPSWAVWEMLNRIVNLVEPYDLDY